MSENYRYDGGVRNDNLENYISDLKKNGYKVISVWECDLDNPEI